MPSCEKRDWQDLLVVYGWEDDMDEEYRVLIPGPITKEMTQDPTAIPDLVVRGDRTYVYKAQERRCDSTWAKDLLELHQWCNWNDITVDAFIQFMTDHDATEVRFGNGSGPSSLHRDFDHVADLVERISGRKVDRPRKRDPRRVAHRCCV